MSRDPMKPIDGGEFPERNTLGANADIPNVKDRISDMASKVKDKAGQVADTVSEKLGQQRGDVMGVLRRYPTQSLIAALAVGFLIGRLRR